MVGNMKNGINEYLADLEYSPMKNLEDIIKFNNSYPLIEFAQGNLDITSKMARQTDKVIGTNQARFEGAVSTHLNSEKNQSFVDLARKIGRTDGIDFTLDHYGVDVIIGPTDSRLYLMCAASGESYLSDSPSNDSANN